MLGSKHGRQQVTCFNKSPVETWKEMLKVYYSITILAQQSCIFWKLKHFFRRVHAPTPLAALKQMRTTIPVYFLCREKSIWARAAVSARLTRRADVRVTRACAVRINRACLAAHVTRTRPCVTQKPEMLPNRKSTEPGVNRDCGDGASMDKVRVSNLLSLPGVNRRDAGRWPNIGCGSLYWSIPADTRLWTSVVLMVGQRLRRWPNIKTTLV